MRPSSLLASPVFLISVGTLLINDHVLKSVWPGFVTGKLSDVAGVAMMAVLLTALCGRAVIGFGATAVGFALLKSVPFVATVTAPLLGGVTRTDPTDLGALIVLAPLWIWVGRRRRDVAIDRRSWIVAVQIVAVSTAVFATTATSCGEQGVTGFDVEADGSIRAVGAGAISADGGRTWTESSGERVEGSGDRAPAATKSTTYELVDEPGFGRSLVARRDGTEATVFRVDRDAIEQLDRLDPPACHADTFSGLAAVERDDGTHAVVGMGWLGVIHVGPDDVAEWVAVSEYGVQETDVSSRPLGVDVASPIGTKGFGFAIPQQGLLTMYLIAAVLPFAAIPVVILLARRRHRSFTGGVWWCVGSGVVLAMLWGLMALLGPMTGARGRLPTAVAIVVLGLAVANVAPVLLWRHRPAPPPADDLPDPDGSWNDSQGGRPLRPPRPEERVG